MGPVFLRHQEGWKPQSWNLRHWSFLAPGHIFTPLAWLFLWLRGQLWEEGRKREGKDSLSDIGLTQTELCGVDLNFLIVPHKPTSYETECGLWGSSPPLGRPNCVALPSIL